LYGSVRAGRRRELRLDKEIHGHQGEASGGGPNYGDDTSYRLRPTAARLRRDPLPLHCPIVPPPMSHGSISAIRVPGTRPQVLPEPIPTTGGQRQPQYLIQSGAGSHRYTWRPHQRRPAQGHGLGPGGHALPVSLWHLPVRPVSAVPEEAAAPTSHQGVSSDQANGAATPSHACPMIWPTTPCLLQGSITNPPLLLGLSTFKSPTTGTHRQCLYAGTVKALPQALALNQRHMGNLLGRCPARLPSMAPATTHPQPDRAQRRLHLLSSNLEMETPMPIWLHRHQRNVLREHRQRRCCHRQWPYPRPTVATRLPFRLLTRS